MLSATWTKRRRLCNAHVDILVFYSFDAISLLTLTTIPFKICRTVMCMNSNLTKFYSRKSLFLISKKQTCLRQKSAQISFHPNYARSIKNGPT
jgi:hypothetical protein